jgi:3-oxoacyl-[acyl-carrier protein] reductase
MDLNLYDKVALVTGAGSQLGYGKGVALALAKEGCHVVVDDKDEEFEGAKETAAEIEALGRKALAINADVRVREEVDNMVKAALEKFGQIDILVSNAGVASPMTPFAKTNRELWNYDIETNLFGQMNVVHAVIPHMISRKYGKIILYSGGQGVPNIAAYSASKGGAVSFGYSLAREVGPLGIVVNMIMPGTGETGLGGGSKKLPPGWNENQAKMHPLGRLCTPRDMGNLIAFLVSDANSYMVGQLIRLAPDLYFY